MMSIEILRRNFLLGVGAMAMMASERSSGLMHGTVPEDAPDMSLPLNNLINLIRMQASQHRRDGKLPCISTERWFL